MMRRVDIVVMSFALFVHLIAATAAAICFPSQAFAQVGSVQPLSIEDTIRFSEIGDPNSLSWDDSDSQVAAVSPNGDRFAVVVRAGNVGDLSNDAAIYVYEVAGLFAGAGPRIVARMSSTSRYQPIAWVRWLADGRTLVFAGSQGDDPPTIFAVNTRSGRMRELVSYPMRMEAYEIASSGGRVVALYRDEASGAYDNPECARSGCLVGDENMVAAQFGGGANVERVLSFDVSTGRHRVIPSPVETDDSLQYCRWEWEGQISPNGRYVFRVCGLKPRRWPSWWREYTADPRFSQHERQGLRGIGRQLFIVDLQEGSTRRFSDAPWRWYAADPVWIDDGRRVILAGAVQSLGDVSGEERERRARRLGVVVYDLATGRSEFIGTLRRPESHVLSARWDQAAATLTVRTRATLGRSTNAIMADQIFQRGADGVWRESESTTNSVYTERVGAVELRVEQSYQQRPVLVANNTVAGEVRTLLDPNSWLDERALGRTELIHWDVHGETWSGLLYYPPNFEHGRRYPLVLQTHGFDERRYSLHGASRNFIAQPLASHGMLVLQIREPTVQAATSAGQQEFSTIQAGYEAAVLHLDAMTLIDRARVGIQGWSRSGPWVTYTLTHSSFDFGAAALTSTANYGLWYWTMSGGEFGVGRSTAGVEAVYAGAPLGPNLERYLELAPDMSADRFRTPLWMWSGSVPGLWDLYANLRRQNVPAEYWYLRDSQHDVYKVSQRLLTYGMIVDWFRFWLKGEEDSDPAKAEQYARWRDYRTHFEEVRRSRRPPLLDWSSSPIQ